MSRSGDREVRVTSLLSSRNDTVQTESPGSSTRVSQVCHTGTEPLSLRSVWQRKVNSTSISKSRLQVDIPVSRRYIPVVSRLLSFNYAASMTNGDRIRSHVHAPLCSRVSPVQTYPRPTRTLPQLPLLSFRLCPRVPDIAPKAVKNPKKWPKLAMDLADEDRKTNSFLCTTQAIDVIVGGNKINALPELVESEHLI